MIFFIRIIRILNIRINFYVADNNLGHLFLTTYLCFTKKTWGLCIFFYKLSQSILLIHKYIENLLLCWSFPREILLQFLDIFHYMQVHCWIIFWFNCWRFAKFHYLFLNIFHFLSKKTFSFIKISSMCEKCLEGIWIFGPIRIFLTNKIF